MYDNDSYCDWHHSLELVTSAAAVTELAAGPALGEVWRIIAASCYHDDPAAHSCFWDIRQGATTLPFNNGEVCNQYGQTQLYNIQKVAAPIILRYGEYIVCRTSVVLAANKKFYMALYKEVLVGVTA